MWGDGEKAESLSKPNAARAAQIRNFEAVLYDHARFSYFLDFLSQHQQAHKLLFWFEVEQFKLLAGNPSEMLGRQQSLWDKYMSLESPQRIHLSAAVASRVAALFRRGAPCGYLFCVPQAFAYQELRDVWFPRFRASPSRAALMEHLRMSYPILLPQLLVEGSFRDCLALFLSRPNECPPEVKADYDLWAGAHDALRPLCASVLKTLEQRGAEGLANALGHLLEECGRFRERLLLAGTECIRSETRAAVAQRIGALKAHAFLPTNGAVRAADIEAVRGAVGSLADVLLQAQQQAYRALERELPPALRRSPTFGAFAEDMQSMECVPLQARLITLNHVADVVRKRPLRCQETSVTGRVSHLLRPAPTPPLPPPAAASSVFLVDAAAAAAPAAEGRQCASQRAGDDGIPQLELGSNMRRNASLERDLARRGAVTAAASPATPPAPPPPRAPPRLSPAALDPLLCLSCPQLFFTFEVAVDETADHIEVEKGLGEGAGLFAPSLAGLHACTAVPSEPRAISPAKRANRGRHGPSATAQLAANALLGGAPPVVPLRVARRFRTHVRQLRHVTVLRALRRVLHVPFPGQPPCSALPSNGGARSELSSNGLNAYYMSSQAGEAASGGGSSSECAGGAGRGGSGGAGRGGSGGAGRGGSGGASHIGVGLPPGTSADSRTLNSALLELMEAGLLEALPGYCLPGAIAAVAQAGAVRIAGAEGLAASRALAPSLHHFVITLPRKRKATPGNNGGALSPSDHAAAGTGADPLSHTVGASNNIAQQQQLPPSPRRRRSLPAAVDKVNNVVLYGACLTTWAEAPPPLQQPQDATHDVVFLPRCVAVLSTDPLFDTLRAVALRLAAPSLSTLPSKVTMGAAAASMLPSPSAEAVAIAADQEELEEEQPRNSSKDGSAATATATAAAASTAVALSLLAPPAACPPRGWPLHNCGPPAHPDLPLAALFSALSVDNVLTALRALALERPVVVVGSTRSALALACEGLLALLHPLRWHHMYVPLLPASEIYGFWRAKMVDERGDRQSSPPPQSLSRSRTENNAGPAPPAPSAAASGGAENNSPVVSPVRRGSTQPPRPYFIGLDARLVQALTGDASGADLDASMAFPASSDNNHSSATAAAAAAARSFPLSDGSKGRPASVGRGKLAAAGAPLQPAWAWGVRTRESCVASAQEDPQGRCASSTTAPGDATRECARRLLARAVKIDLDNDEVTMPAGAELGLALPPWPPEPLAAARRRAQLALFPEFYTFDAVPPAPPQQMLTAVASNGNSNAAIAGAVFPPERRQQVSPSKVASGSRPRSGRFAERSSSEDEAGRVREALVKATPPAQTAATSAAGGGSGPPASSQRRLSGGAPGGVEEIVEHMYRPTPADQQLRAAALGLMLSVLGRCKEFTTAFPEHGVVRLDTHAFLEAHGCGLWTDRGGAAEFYRELLRTRAFAALLSDEVAADLDLPKVQVLLAEAEREHLAAAAAAASSAVPGVSIAARAGEEGSPAALS